MRFGFTSDPLCATTTALQSDRNAARKAKKAVKAHGWGVPGLTWMPGEDKDPFGHDDDTPEEDLAE